MTRAHGTSEPICVALKHAQRFCPSHADAWIRVDAHAELLPLVFDLDRRKSEHLTTEVINSCFSKNKVLQDMLDQPQNDVGLHRKECWHREGKKKTKWKCLYSCTCGTAPPKPEGKWHDNIKERRALKPEHMPSTAVGTDDDAFALARNFLLLHVDDIIKKKGKRDQDKAGKATKKKQKTNTAKKTPPTTTPMTTTSAL